MFFTIKPLLFNEVSIGLRIKDSDGDIGIIRKCDDICNILVELESGNGGYTFYCLDPSSKRYENIYPEEVEIEKDKIIICKNCGEAIYMFKDTRLCPRCHEIINKYNGDIV